MKEVEVVVGEGDGGVFEVLVFWGVGVRRKRKRRRI